MRCFVLLMCATAVLSKPEYVTRKLCKNEDVTQCTIRSVIVDPCPQGPYFCTLKRNKPYAVTLDLVPHFSASSLKIEITADVDLSGNYTTSVKTPGNACGLLYCPLQEEERRIFDVNLMLDKRASGKFPVKLKMWNEQNESQSCCLTFTVKVK